MLINKMIKNFAEITEKKCKRLPVIYQCIPRQISEDIYNLILATVA